MLDLRPGIVVVTRKTRMEGLLARWATRGGARFALARAKVGEMERAGKVDRKQVEALADAEYEDLDLEDAVYHDTIADLRKEFDFELPIQFVDREFLPNLDFARYIVVVVVGQDGLVANTAKYVGNVPIVAVNPDPGRFDGVLLPFQMREARSAVARVLEQRARTRDVTLAEANLHDGQKLLAFNDLFIGTSSHVSARYVLRAGRQSEPQSSSGMIVSTGAGSTGWMSSVFNMAAGITRSLAAPAGRSGNEAGSDVALEPFESADGQRSAEVPPQHTVEPRLELAWEDRALAWAVREPFASRTSRADMVFGMIPEGQELVVESQMPSGGVIFSDGVEADFLEFNGGSIVRIGVSKQRARLVVQ